MMISTGSDTLETLPVWRLDPRTITAKAIEGEVRVKVDITSTLIKTKMVWMEGWVATFHFKSVWYPISSPVYTALENWRTAFSLINVFRPHHTTPEKFENLTVTSHFGFVFEEKSGREIT